MPGMDIVLLVTQALLLATGYLVVRYVKGLPEAMHQRTLKGFEHKLSVELETLKADLAREIELLKIAQAQVQSQKVTEFSKLGEFFNRILASAKGGEGYDKPRTKKKRVDLQKEFLDIGNGLFFYASDETVKHYIDFRRIVYVEKEASMRLIQTYGKLVASMRRDLGHADSKLTAEDYLMVAFTDWHKILGDPER